MTTGGTGDPADGGLEQFVAGVLIGLIAMVAVVLFALWELGYMGASDEEAEAPSAVLEDDEARPTPVWRFRDEWLTPRPKANGP